jgi:hypothetical protein
MNLRKLCVLQPRLKEINATQRLALVLLVLCFSSCRVETVKHDPIKAVDDANDFLKALYLDENYPLALEVADVQLRQSLTANDLRQLVEGVKQERGKLKTLKADSYLMVQGRGMELFYVGSYQKGPLYHRLVLMGDLPTGYKVSGVWYSLDPYPEQVLRRKFNQEILVK